MLQSRLEKQAFQEDENTKLHPSSSRLYQLLQSRLEKQAFQERKDSFFDTVMGKIISSCNPAQKSRHFKYQAHPEFTGRGCWLVPWYVSGCNPAQKSRHFKWKEGGRSPLFFCMLQSRLEKQAFQAVPGSQMWVPGPIAAIPPRKAGISRGISMMYLMLPIQSAAIPPRKAGISRYEVVSYPGDIYAIPLVLQSRLEKQAFQDI